MTIPVPSGSVDDPFLALAPMDGVTDGVFRELMTDRDGGGISVCVSEFVRVTREPAVPSVLLRHCPELRTGGRTRGGVPVQVQLLGGAPEPMARTAELAAAMGAAGIDLNFGCPAKTVNNHDGGAILLREPRRVEAVTRAVRDRIPSHLPVTVKIRLGWDSATDVESIARAAEDGGATWLTIHARTRMQSYRPPVDWLAIGRARQAIAIPVVANGDLFSARDVARCRDLTGCHGFMIGRGSMAYPGIFAEVRGRPTETFTRRGLCAMLLDYDRRLRSAGYTPKRALGRVKQWLRYAAPAGDTFEAAFDRIKRMNDDDVARSTLEDYAAQPARVGYAPRRATQDRSSDPRAS